KFSIIAEAKKSSPSEGIIREDFDIREIVKTYKKNGADALSILTDEKFFQGSLDNLRIARESTALPILRKDFILHELQIEESKEVGSDAILLIAAILDDEQIKDLYLAAKYLKLDVVFEIHDERELERIMRIEPEIVGVNNRDLKTFKVDIRNFERLSRIIPEKIIKIAESGINSRSDLNFIKENNADAVLIGTTFMKSENIENKFKELIND
ncbi:MAG TPA: indole-3-glycerol phosphate synthase TrpC, partial [Candidatus Dojkabacteria bacterium]